MWHKIRLFVVYSFAFCGVMSPLWSAGLVEASIAMHGARHIASDGPAVPEFSRFFAEYVDWCVLGSKLLTALGVLSAVVVYRLQNDARSRVLGVLCIGAFGYHLALMMLASYLVAFFVLPAAASGAAA